MASYVKQFSSRKLVFFALTHVTQVTGALKDSYMEMNDEQEKLLEACSSADKVTYVSKDLANGALNHTHLHVSNSLGKKTVYI